MDDKTHFLNRLFDSVFDEAHADDHGLMRHNALLTTLFAWMDDAGMASNAESTYFRLNSSPIAEVHGYAFDNDDDIVSLFYLIDANSGTPLGREVEPTATPKGDIDKGFKRLQAFVRRILKKGVDSIDESHPAWEMGKLIQQADSDSMAIQLHVITTGVATELAVAARPEFDYETRVLDLTRLVRTCGSGNEGTTDLNFMADYDGPLACLVAPQDQDGLQVLLLSIPGQLLADIYNLHRSALLERNVRSFLQFTGKVNKGIRHTLLREPGRFLPYNNGISATARAVDLDVAAGGIGWLQAVEDFQIVNGGQTTASLASAARKDKADLSKVMVQMKLTVVPPSRVNEIVPKISRFANTQNKVQDSDFSANEEWHIGVKEHADRLWTLPTDTLPGGSRWFYERSRGQYADRLAQCATAAKKKKFRNEHPRTQRFSKTDVAKYIMSWEQRPHVVSLGAQKCFREFMDHLGPSAQRRPSESEFRRYIALAILFKRCEKLHDSLGYKGFRSNVVTYTIATLSYISNRRIDYERVWKTQRVTQELEDAAGCIMQGVRHIITNPPPSRRNASEWAKRVECWARVQETKFEVELTYVASTKSVDDAALGAGLSTEELIEIKLVTQFSVTMWLDLMAWAASADRLTMVQRNQAKSMSSHIERKTLPSVKQARKTLGLLLEAIQQGFEHLELTDEVVLRLKQSA